MTNSDNFTRLTLAINMLGETLRPYIERELKRGGGNWWTRYVLPNVSHLSRQRFPAMPERGSANQLSMADFSDLLSLLTRNWNEVFRGRLPPAARSWANELLDSRNQWAHKGSGDLPVTVVDRAIDTAALLLDSIDPSSAGTMRAFLSSAVVPRPVEATPTKASRTMARIRPVVSRSNHGPAYWAIAPFNPEAGLVDRTWAYDREHGVVAIGWDRVREDISQMDAASLQLAMEKHYPDQPGGWRSLWAFYHRIQVGDYVVARTGRSTALGIGRVMSAAYRDDAKGQERTGGYHAWFKPHFRNVEWLSTKQAVFEHFVFSIPTVTQLNTHLDEVLSRYPDAGC